MFKFFMVEVIQGVYSPNSELSSSNRNAIPLLKNRNPALQDPSVKN